MDDFLKNSFVRGELSPELYGRTDIDSYNKALKTALNVVISPSGSLFKRNGLQFLGPCKTHTGEPPFLYVFRYSRDDTYLLEFGHLYMRPYRNDRHVFHPPHKLVEIERVPVADSQHRTRIRFKAADIASKTVIFNNGQQYYLTNTQDSIFDGLWVEVEKTNTTDGYLKHAQTGKYMDDPTFKKGTVSLNAPVELITPYTLDDCRDLSLNQNGNQITICHNRHNPRILTRQAHASWQLSNMVFGLSQNHPSAPSLTNRATGSGIAQFLNKTYSYVITATNANTGEESIAGPTGSVTSDNRGAKVYMTWSAPADGEANIDYYSVYKNNNGLYGWIGNAGARNFLDENIKPDMSLTPPKYYNPFANGNYPAISSYYQRRQVFAGTKTHPDTVYYSKTNLYQNFFRSTPRQSDDSIEAQLPSNGRNTIRGLISAEDLIVFTDSNEWIVNSGQDTGFSLKTMHQTISSDYGISLIKPVRFQEYILFVPESENTVYSYGISESTTKNVYQGEDLSVFSSHLFKHDSIIDFALARKQAGAAQIAAVRADGECPVLSFNQAQKIIGWTRWTTKGNFKRAAAIRPNRNSLVEELYFVVERRIQGKPAYYIERTREDNSSSNPADQFFLDSGLALESQFAAPITKIVDHTDNMTIYADYEEGFLRNGDLVLIDEIQWQASVDKLFNETQPEFLNNNKYLINISSTGEIVLLDEDVFEGTDLSIPRERIKTTLTIESSLKFKAGDVLYFFEVPYSKVKTGSYAIEKVESLSNIKVKITLLWDTRDIGTGISGKTFKFRRVVTFNKEVIWKQGGRIVKETDSINRLWHLEGETLMGLGDGNVMENLKVEKGKIKLPKKFGKFAAGYRYNADIETLALEDPSGRNLIQGKKKRVPKVRITMADTRGLLVGPNQKKLVAIKERQFERYGEPTRLYTGGRNFYIPSDWLGNGQVFIRQAYPLPMNVQAIVGTTDIEE